MDSASLRSASVGLEEIIVVMRIVEGGLDGGWWYPWVASTRLFEVKCDAKLARGRLQFQFVWCFLFSRELCLPSCTRVPHSNTS